MKKAVFRTQIERIGASRDDAEKRGLNKYFGPPCEHNHYSEEKAARYLSSYECVSCAKAGAQKRKGKRGNPNAPTAQEFARMAIDHAKPEYVDDYYKTLLD